jgi:hypothetical protein
MRDGHTEVNAPHAQWWGHKTILKTTFWVTAGSWDFFLHQFKIITKFLPESLPSSSFGERYTSVNRAEILYLFQHKILLPQNL